MTRSVAVIDAPQDLRFPGQLDGCAADGGRRPPDLGYSFTNDEVTSQLTAQQITFPATSDAAFKALPAADQTAMAPYAGQLMTDGAQAQVYADNFIAVHLKEIGDGGKTYSQLSAESRANPGNAKLAAQVQTVFQGTTLRGLLLSSYAFWQIGQIALIAGIVALCAAFVMLILTVLGFWHLRRASPEAELLGGGRTA